MTHAAVAGHKLHVHGRARPVPTGGTVVTVAYSSSVASGSTTVTVPGGEESAWFVVSTSSVTTATKVTITATLGATSSSAVLLVNPPPPTGTLVFLPNPVTGGDNAIGLLNLSSPATTNLTVTVTSSNSSVAEPDASFTIPAGSTWGEFNVNTFTVNASTAVTITATVRGQKITATLTVKEPKGSSQLTQS